MDADGYQQVGTSIVSDTAGGTVELAQRPQWR